MSEAMDDRGITGRVFRVVAHETDRPAESILPTQRLNEDLGVDSLDFVKLVGAIEDTFGIVVEDERAAAIETVGDLLALVRAARADGRPITRP